MLRSGCVMHIGVGFAASLIGCVSPVAEGDGVIGSPSDVEAEPGEYDGYRLSDACSYSSTFGVQGTGTEWFQGIGPEDEARPEALDALAQQAISPVLGDVASVWGLGWGLACDTVGVIVWMNDWRDVDVVIERSGEVLREGSLREEVSISVGGVPVPH